MRVHVCKDWGCRRSAYRCTCACVHSVEECVCVCVDDRVCQRMRARVCGVEDGVWTPLVRRTRARG